MTNKIDTQTIIDIQTLYKAGSLSQFYYSRSIGDIQLTDAVRKKVSVAYLKDGGPDKYPKQFYFISDHRNIDLYHNMQEIIWDYEMQSGVIITESIGDNVNGK